MKQKVELRIKFDNVGIFLVDHKTGKRLSKTFELEDEVLFSEIDHLIQTDINILRAPEIILKAVENILGIKPIRNEGGYSTYQTRYFQILIAYVKGHQKVKGKFERCREKAQREKMAKMESEKRKERENAESFKRHIRK